MANIEEQQNTNNEVAGVEKTERRLTSDRAMSREKSWSEQLRGKARAICGGFMVMTAITMGEGTAQAKALSLDVDHGESVEEFEAREDSQERAVAFLGKLIQAHAPTNRPLSEAQKEILTNRAARVMIQGFAAQEKRVKENLPPGSAVDINFKDTCDALDVLNGASDEFAQRHYKGNIGEAQKQMATNPGLHTFMEMSAQCR